MAEEAAADDLMFYFSETCPFTQRVLPEVECLQQAMPEGRSLQRLEIRSDKTNYGRYQEAAQGKCRGVPFFINSKTGNFVCGAAPCATLKERLL
ncbi:uncharacterized protein ACA1_272280 [Acanthamoeba castellanii str. Neff]|uniref:Uncharacterized protein n=1 Tax=Acanthamoeba castellanii (strain ATCC 30010 / Neff) TaxID=1257118 RepID=L8HG45_ACACF|nr:uncharacterized protein ACA1_272280 [Acanthamoeba castellanii str. Neff]ELR24227.1 hypothetical protein ACA1_272280 [Acanthamoeba castellanii str. Neff]